MGLLVDPSKLDPTASTTLELVSRWNADKVSQQNDRFNELMEKYVEEEEETGTPEKEAAEKSTPEIDPLTAMMMEQEAQETRKAELLLKYRKERARRKRGLTVDDGATICEESDGIDRASVSAKISSNQRAYPLLILIQSFFILFVGNLVGYH